MNGDAAAEANNTKRNHDVSAILWPCSKLHVEESLLTEGNGIRPHIDPERWHPLIMSFCRFFGLGDEVQPSRLADSEFMRAMTRVPAFEPAGAGGGPFARRRGAASATAGSPRDPSRDAA